MLTFKGDGTGTMNASVSVFGSSSGGSTAAKWECIKDKLTLAVSDGSARSFTVVSKSRTDLVLQDLANGSLVNFKKISDQ